jgi:hypothetical protein
LYWPCNPKGQPDARDRIDPSVPDTALDIKSELSTQEQILSFDRTARSERERPPAKRIVYQLEQNSQDRQHRSIMP